MLELDKQQQEILTMYLRRLEQDMANLQSTIDSVRKYLKNNSGWV